MITQGWHRFPLFTDEKTRTEVGSGLSLPGAGTQPRASADGASPWVGCCYRDESWLVTGAVSFRRNFYILPHSGPERKSAQSFEIWEECPELHGLRGSCFVKVEQVEHPRAFPQLSALVGQAAGGIF